MEIVALSSEQPATVAVLIGEGAYGVLDMMARRLADAFEESGARVLRIDAEFAAARRGKREVFEEVRAFQPELFVSMNLTGLVEIDGAWLPDFLGVPCLSWMVDHPAFFLNGQSPLYDLRKSSNYFVAAVDPKHLAFLKRFYPADRIFFLPHAAMVPSDAPPVCYSDRIAGAVLTAGVGNRLAGSSVSVQSESWSEGGSWMRRSFRIIHRSVLADQGLDVYEQVEGLLRVAPSDRLDALAVPISAFEQLEGKLRQEVRRAMLKRLAESAAMRIDIFGDPAWKEIESDTVRYCGQADYRTIPDLFRRYRYVLNPQPPQTRNGSHERVVEAISAGTMPITLTNDFYREQFGDSIAHVRITDEDLSMNLPSESEYGRCLDEARRIVRERHTWNCRARFLLDRFCRAKTVNR